MNAESFLKEELKKLDVELGGNHSSKKTVFSYPEFSLVDLLQFIATEEIFFFESKEEDFSFLGLGKSLELDAIEAFNYLRKNPEETLVYQGHFEDDLPPIIYLPEWSMVKKGGLVTLRVHHSQEYQSFSPTNILFNTQVWESFVNHWTSYEERPESDEWNEMIKQSLRLFSRHDLEKIVLSRKKIFTYDEPVELAVMFRELYEANVTSSHFSVFHQLHYNKAFVSFTPERLFTLKNNELETISLAGSIQRGNNDQEDTILEDSLKSSDKLTREHGIVTESIKMTLTPLTESLIISPLVTMKLPYIQHRQATIKGILKKETTVFELIDKMHPTPAVGGIPFEKAREKILEIEKEKRGYYAAPVGVLSAHFSELAVGIRSALMENLTVTVYGGAGIVAGSIAEEEWTETGTKMQPFIKVINKSVI